MVVVSSSVKRHVSLTVRPDHSTADTPATPATAPRSALALALAQRPACVSLSACAMPCTSSVRPLQVTTLRPLPPATQAYAHPRLQVRRARHLRAAGMICDQGDMYIQHVHVMSMYMHMYKSVYMDMCMYMHPTKGRPRSSEPDGPITTSHPADGPITTSHPADGPITTSHPADGPITTSHPADDRLAAHPVIGPPSSNLDGSQRPPLAYLLRTSYGWLAGWLAG